MKLITLSKRIFLTFIMLFPILTFTQSKPNIVIILADDLGYGSVGAYGAPAGAVKTPAIDNLSKKGRKFLNAYTPASLCSPSRYGLITGRYYWRDVRDWGIIKSTDPCVILENKFNIASRLKKEGYNTGGIGKWHLGYNTITKKHDIPDYIGFDTWHDYRVRNGNRISKKDTRIMEYLNEEVNTWIDKQSNAKPFFLYFAPISIHTPIIPGIAYQGKSGGGPYTDYIMELDGSVNNIVEALERNNLSENTIIIFTSDNGAVTGQAREALDLGGLYANGTYVDNPRNFRGSKLRIHEAGFKVPLIIKWPNNIPEGTTSKELINLVDIYASIMEALDINMLPNNEEAEDSYSFYPAWFDDLAEPIRDNMIVNNYEGIKAVYKNEWKYIDGVVRQPEPYHFFNAKRQESEAHKQLYNISNDPFEKNDYIDTNTDVANEMSNLLSKIVNQGYSRPKTNLSFKKEDKQSFFKCLFKSDK